jgi:hypothetical protein
MGVVASKVTTPFFYVNKYQLSLRRQGAKCPCLKPEPKKIGSDGVYKGDDKIL